MPRTSTHRQPTQADTRPPCACTRHGRAAAAAHRRTGRAPHTRLLHGLQELDDHLGARADEDLPLAPPLGIHDGLQAVVQHRHQHHGWLPRRARTRVSAAHYTNATHTYTHTWPWHTHSTHACPHRTHAHLSVRRRAALSSRRCSRQTLLCGRLDACRTFLGAAR